MVSSSSMIPVGFRKLKSHRLILALVVFATLALIHTFGTVSPLSVFRYNTSHPYAHWREHEKSLPQHDPSLPTPEGANGKYLFMRGHMWGVGLNNVLQEYLLNALLAYESGRAFVFYDFIIDLYGDQALSFDHGTMVPTRIPFTAIVSGPIVGDPFPSTVNGQHPRAVSEAYFTQLCPNPTVLTDQSVRVPDNASADEMMTMWVNHLAIVKDGCVRIDWENDHVFSRFVYGNPLVLDIWPRLSSSPIFRYLDWSEQVRSALPSNAERFFPPRSFFETLTSPSRSRTVLEESINAPTIPGLLALHIRRGDFEGHCKAATGNRWPMHGYNLLSVFPDPFDPQIYDDSELEGIYIRRCYPSITDIVARVAEVRRLEIGAGLKRVFIMTNGDRHWVGELKAALLAMGGWDTDGAAVMVGRDMALTQEQAWIAQAVDMYIAQKAAVFIGNGFSSMTANVNLLRLRANQPLQSNRFW